MRKQELDDLCEKLWNEWQADPYELFLTPDSHAELLSDVLPDIEDVHLLSPSLTKFANSTTGSIIDIRRSELPYDTAVVELRLGGGR